MITQGTVEHPPGERSAALVQRQQSACLLADRSMSLAGRLAASNSSSGCPVGPMHMPVDVRARVCNHKPGKAEWTAEILMPQGGCVKPDSTASSAAVASALCKT